MALIKFGNGVASISGRIDGTVFSRTRAGAVARGWSKPTSTPTFSQNQRRAAFAVVSAAYSALTGPQRDAWRVAAETAERQNRFGDKYTPAGRQMFMEVNLNLNNVGVAMFTIPPDNFEAPPPPSPVTAVATVAADGQPLTTLTATVPAAGDYVFQMVNPYYPGVNADDANVSRQWKQIHAESESGTTIMMASDVAEVFPEAVFAANDVIQLRCAQIGENGVQSAWIMLGKIAVTSGD